MFMFRVRPWVYDIIGRRDYDRISRIERQEVYSTYRILQFQGGVHPQRESSDYGLLNDALFEQDL